MKQKSSMAKPHLNPACARRALLGFLPKRAILMTRPRTASALPPVTRLQTETLESVQLDLGPCTRCKLCQGRKNIVFGEGDPQASLVFVGEGPGEQEDWSGRPFVGKAGQLLDRMIEAMGLKRERVYICNVVKCRPPGNRNPEPDEIASCQPFLFRQLEVIQPKVIVALGKFAAQTMLETQVPISRLRGQFRDWQPPQSGASRARGWKARLMPTFHPAYLLRNPESKREAWADLQAVAAELGIQIPKPGRT